MKVDILHVDFENNHSVHKILLTVLAVVQFFQDSPFFQNYAISDEVLGDGSFSTCR